MVTFSIGNFSIVQITSLFDTLRGAWGSYRFAISARSSRSYPVISSISSVPTFAVFFSAVAAAAADAAPGDEVSSVGALGGVLFDGAPPVVPAGSRNLASSLASASDSLLIDTLLWWSICSCEYNICKILEVSFSTPLCTDIISTAILDVFIPARGLMTSSIFFCISNVTASMPVIVPILPNCCTKSSKSINPASSGSAR